MLSGMGWRWGAVTGLAVVSIAGSALMWNHYRDDLAVAWTVIAGFVAVMAAAVSWARAGAGRKRPTMSVGAEQLADAAEGLARAVQQQWRAESDLRRLQDPWPLPVRWVTTSRSVMDYWAAVRGVPGEDAPLDLSGELDEITEAFARIPSGRLVLLGRGGAGKTVLLMQLVLGLLESWTIDKPVPVLLSVAAWDPALPLETWLVTRLEEEYPRLATHCGSEATLARELVRVGRVLPVLDGLDEIPRALRIDALRAANLASTRLARLVVSCRTKEYVETVESGDVLSRAAVVELSPLPVAELQKYLRVTTPPGRAGLWDNIFDAMTGEPDGPLAQALSTPLMAWLARIGYGETSHSPDELLDVNADGSRVFASRSMAEERLLDRYIPAVYGSSSEQQSRYSAKAADHWLTFLAVHLHRLGTRDLAWWQFLDAVPSFWPGVGFVAGIAVGLVMGLIYKFAGGLVAELVVGLVGSVVGVIINGARAEIRAQFGIRFLDGFWSLHSNDVGVGLLGGIGAGFAAGIVAGVTAGIIASVTAGIALASGSSRSTTVAAVSAPLPAAIRLKGRLRQVSVRFAHGVVAGGVIGIGMAIAIDLTIGTSAGPIIVPVFAGVAGLVGGLVFGFLEVLSVPNDPELSRSPLTSLRVDRNATVASTIVATLVTGGVAGITFGFVFGFWGGVAFGLTLGFAAGLIVGLLLGGAWGRFMLVRVPLALTGRTPWTLIAFLEDAHLRGVLRQAGGVYQFRHARLQDRLIAHDLAHAARPGAPTPPTTTVTTSS